MLKFSNDRGIKLLNGLSPDIMNDVLIVSKHGKSSTRHFHIFVTDWPETDIYGQYSIQC